MLKTKSPLEPQAQGIQVCMKSQAQPLFAGSCEADVHAIVNVVVEDFLLKSFVFVVIIAKPLASKLLKENQLRPKALVQIRPSFAATVHVPWVALVFRQHRQESFVHVKETIIWEVHH
jgi:hypothetical protein